MGKARIPEETVKAAAFKEREDTLARGLVIFMQKVLGDYLSDGQILDMAEMFKSFRSVPLKSGSISTLCRVISEEGTIVHRFIPRKRLRKDDLAAFLYFLSNYTCLSRIETAEMAKLSFPNFFSTTNTVNATMTKRKAVHLGSDKWESALPLTLEEVCRFPDVDLETGLMDLALMQETL